MNNSTDTTNPGDTKPAAEFTVAAPHRTAGSTQLRLLVAAVGVAAAWLCYQAANEAIALNRVLDQVHAVAGESLLARTAAQAGAKITETKPRVAGL